MQSAKMPHALDWDDLRLVLAVYREGGLSGAAKSLRLTHSTVFRRLGAIEQRIGVRLFERHRDGYAPTPAGETAAASAARLEDEVLALAWTAVDVASDDVLSSRLRERPATGATGAR